MLRSAPSLAGRASLIFLPIYIGISLAGMTYLSFLSLSTGQRHHSGPRVALTYLADELQYALTGDLSLPPNGPFGQLAAVNPSMWVLAENKGRLYSFGPVPAGARTAFRSYVDMTDTALFYVPGVSRPLSDAALQRHDSAYGQALLAAGGVDPETISLADTFRFFLSERFFLVIGVFGGFGLLAMLVALPLLLTALKPLAREAAAIRPDEPGCRLSEAGVWRELLPLVNGFNGALDKLSDEVDRRQRMIANLAHELRTPLAIVSLQAAALRNEEERIELQRVVRRLSDMVGQMLDVERLVVTPQRERTDLTALASQVIGDMAPMAIQQGYDLALSAPDKPVWVMADPLALGRAISNLVGNAIAHGGGSGPIDVVVSESRDLRVIDQGPGIAENIRSSLFQPFARERWDRDGCGLGLHLAREIVRAHGGDAVLLPNEIGAAFCISLPSPNAGAPDQS